MFRIAEEFQRESGSWHRAPHVRDSEGSILRRSVARPADGGTVRLSALADATGDYTVEIDANRLEVRLLRTYADRAPSRLNVWPLPHDVWQSGSSEPFELLAEQRSEDGPVAELTLRCRGEVMGVAIDLYPRRW
jgi:hypothetical protein